MALNGMKKKIKDFMMRDPRGMVWFYRLRILREKWVMREKDDAVYLHKVYRERFGRELNLKDPVTFSEKQNWLKLFYREERMPVCSDKFAVRDYVRAQGLEHLLNDCCGVYNRAEEIDFDALPDRFVMKATHGSGWNLVCKDKSALDLRPWKKVMNLWLKLRLWVYGREWNYQSVPPRLIAERFLDADPLIDYKFFCFHGEPRLMQINNDHDGQHFVDFYDMDWQPQGFTFRGYRTDPKHRLEKPERFAEMCELARVLSGPFPFVRVDFYQVEDRIIFGELTFFPGGALRPFVPEGDRVDRMLGELLTLPQPNHNMELFRKLHHEERI